MGDDKEEHEIEGFEGEEVEEVLALTKKNKRKSKAQPVTRAKKTIKPRKAKHTTPTARLLHMQ